MHLAMTLRLHVSAPPRSRVPLSKRPEMLLFIERHVWRGLFALRFLGGCATRGWFFSSDNTCPYGGYPLSFAAATGSSYWVRLWHCARRKPSQPPNAFLAPAPRS